MQRFTLVDGGNSLPVRLAKSRGWSELDSPNQLSRKFEAGGHYHGNTNNTGGGSYV